MISFESDFSDFSIFQNDKIIDYTFQTQQIISMENMSNSLKDNTEIISVCKDDVYFYHQKCNNNFTIETKEIFDFNDEEAILIKEKKTKCIRNQIFQCVLSSTKGNYLPISKDINENDIKIKWLNYRGYRASPFKDPPCKLKRAITKWKNEIKKEPVEIPEESQGNNVCFICEMHFDCTPNEHINSEIHQKNFELLDWNELDNLKKELDEEFFQKINDKLS